MSQQFCESPPQDQLLIIANILETGCIAAYSHQTQTDVSSVGWQCVEGTHSDRMHVHQFFQAARTTQYLLWPHNHRMRWNRC